MRAIPASYSGGYLRLPQIIGQEAVSETQARENQFTGKGPKRSRPALQGILPISRSAWFGGVASGKYPKPIRLGARISLWRVEDVLAVIEKEGV